MPVAVVTVSAFRFVAWFTAWIVAPGITLPLGSETRPAIEPRPPCASRIGVQRDNNKETEKRRIIDTLLPSVQFDSNRKSLCAPENSIGRPAKSAEISVRSSGFSLPGPVRPEG